LKAELGLFQPFYEVTSLLRSFSITLLSLAFLLSASGQGPSKRNSGGRPFHNEAERAARWKPVAMPYHRAALTPREQQMVAKLADACRLMDTLYWQQSDLGGLAVYRVTQNATLARLFSIMGSRYDYLNLNDSLFVGKVHPREYN